MSERKEFTPETKKKVLLWSDRHCCLCEKSCGIDIEIHHIEGVDNNDIGNAIPLCYDCHAKIHHYNVYYKMGTKYKPNELKTRRDQIYERYTMPLVPPVDYRLGDIYYQNGDKNKPRTQYSMSNLGNSYPIRALVKIITYIGEKCVGTIKVSRRPYYSGDLIWNLNPQYTCHGNFPMQKEWFDNKIQPILEINVTIIDVYDRYHDLLPICYRLASLKGKRIWNLEPTSYNELKKFYME